MGKGGGRLTLVENWGRRQLAYPVQKHTRGVYVYLKYTGGGELVSELERNFRMLDDVLKFQTVKVGEDLDPGSIQVDDAAVKFEDLAPVEEEEPEETLEQQLGLEDPPPGETSRARGNRDQGDEDSNGDDDNSSSNEAASGGGAEEEEED
jgi:small subunit ribosomal protein S6